MGLYIVFKTHTPISIFEIFQQSNRETNFLVKVPDVPLKTSKCNFAYNNSEASDNGIVIMGSSENSDLCASVPYVKNALKAFLLSIQKYGSDDLWEPSNFL